MKHIKNFENVNAADGWVIDNPFVSGVEGEDLIYCNESNKKLEVEGGQIVITDNTPSKIKPTVSFKPIEYTNDESYVEINEQKINIGTTIQYTEGDSIYIQVGVDYFVRIQIITNSDGEISFEDAEGYHREVPVTNIGNNVFEFYNYEWLSSGFGANIIISETNTHERLVIPFYYYGED